MRETTKTLLTIKEFFTLRDGSFAVSEKRGLDVDTHNVWVFLLSRKTDTPLLKSRTRSYRSLFTSSLRKDYGKRMECRMGV